MSNFIYTNHKETPDSSVISDLYYNSDFEELVVVLHSGDYAGYENVPLTTYLAMATHYDARNEGGSLGRYWNTDVKGKFDGLDTSWIVDFAEDNDGAVLDNEIPFVASVGGTSFQVTDIGTAQVVDMNLPKNEYTVAFDFSSFVNSNGTELTVFASSPDDALVRFNNAVAQLGYNNVKVKAVTRHFV